MAARGLLVLFLFGLLALVEAAPTRTYSQQFIGGQTPTSAMCSGWLSWANGVDPNPNAYSRIEVWSSFNNIVYTCSTQSAVNTLANRLRFSRGEARTANVLTCNGNTWAIGGSCGPACGADMALAVGIGSSCSCSGLWTIRANIWNLNWGGAGGSTCSQPTQVLNVRLVGGGCSDATNSPVISCPSTVSVSTDSGQCCSVETYSVSASDPDSCSVLTGPTRTQGRASGSCFTNNEVVAYSVRDSAGNTDVCSWAYVVNDNQNPSISCQSAISANTASNSCSAAVSYSTPLASDNCGISSVQRISGPPSGGQFGLGTSTVTYRATDTSSRTSTCSISVTVSDATNPTIACPVSFTVSTATNQCGASVSYSAPSLSDNCPGPTSSLISGQASGSFFSRGATSQIFRALDASGNSQTCTFSITVQDTVQPSISCPSSVTANAANGQCSQTISYANPSVSDNCAGVNFARIGGLGSGSSFPVGSTAQTFRATDSSGNQSLCGFTVTIVDNQAPVINCPSPVTVPTNPGQCSGTVSYSQPTASDNCGSVSVTRLSGPASPSVFGVGSYTASYRAVDGAGRTATCPIPISVVDQQDPTVNCPSPVVVSTPPSASACSTAVTITSATVGDNCPGSSVSGLSSGTYTFAVGTSGLTYIGSDSAGNSATCTASITVTDGTDPEANCPASITASANSGTCSSIISYSAPTMSDNCSGGTIVRQSGPASGSTFNVGTSTIVYRATDSAGNQDTCSFTVTINDNQNPTITCPSSTTVSASNSCDAVVNYVTPSASDNCGAVSISRTAGLASGSTFPIGSTTQTFLATDGGGRTASCSFSVVVEDNTDPVITCPANVAVAASSGSCGATVSYSAPTATDNCGSTSIALVGGIGNGGIFPLGTTTEVYRATDSAGRTHACSFTVTVTDQSVPSITCPASITTTTGPMQCGASVSFTTPTTSDNCGATVAQISGIASGGFFPTGVTTQVFEATDGAGNSQQCTFTVTVNDGEDPVASCPGDIVEPNDLGACGAFVNYVSPTVADNCPGFTIVLDSGIGSGNFFPVGVTTEVFEATDPAGNTHQCSFTVTVQDTESPQASCPASAVIANDAGVCSADVFYVSPTVTDNCPGATVSLHTGFGIGGTFPEGISTEVWRAVDSAGNTNDCSFTVEVDDTENPMPSCPGGQSANTDAGQCSAAVVYAAPTVGDNCPGSSISLLSGFGSGGVFPLGNSMEVYRGIDGTGNTNDCNFSVVVTDAEAPTISCPSSVSVSSDAGSCTAVVPYASPTFADNCPGSSMSQTGGMGSGSAFPIGVTTEIYEAVDGAGNTASCQFTVTVGDSEAPVASCPAPVTVTSDAGQCSAVVSYSAPTVTDNCAGATITLNSGIGNGGTFPLGVSTEVYEATDAAGNTHQCSFTVTVTDNENPVPTCPASFTATTDAGQCGAVVNFAAPTATDNCAGQSITLFAGIANGFFPTGVTTQVYEAVDAAGNSAQCAFTVTVNDGESPVASCPANIAVNTDLGNCGAVVTYSSPTTADNCLGDSIAIFSGLGSGGTFPKGTSTEVWEATDAAGNTHQCSFTVTVTDVEIPQASCPADITTSMDAGLCSATVTYTTPTTTDNCPGDSIALFGGLGSGAAFPEGVSTEVWEATDADGNTHQCSFTVTVQDAESPVSSCPSSFAVSNDAGVCGATVTYAAPTASDNCVVVSVVQTVGLGSGAVFPVGLTTETYEATDSNGNTHTCSFQVTVNEVEPPVVTCPSSFAVSTDPGVCTAVVTYSTPSITDNCPGASVTLLSGLGSGGTFPIGPNSEVYGVTDGAGNTHQCSFIVTVVDNELPVATCPSPLIVGNDPGRCDANVSYAPPTVTDNCPGASIGLTSGTGIGGVFPLGSSIDEHTAVDAEGNVHTCFVPVTVEDRESPVPTCYGDVTSGNDAGACGAVVSYTVPSVTDNCPPASIFLQSGIGDGLFFPTGTTVETYHASDSAGNTAQCGFNVVVSDLELPVVNCPGNINAPNDPSRCDAVVTYATPTATDNCVVSSVSHVGGMNSGAKFPVGFTTETWHALDQDGNLGQCSFTVEVQDLQLPTITCPPSVNVPNDAGQCGAVVAYVAPVAADNCVVVNVVQTLGLGSSSLFPIGQTTEQYTVTDNSGNVATCSFTVTVAEAEDPVASCPGNISVNNDAGQCAAVVTYPAPTASDNCPGATIAQTSGLGSGSTFPVGSTTEIYTATDNAGRTHSCQFIVEVLETELPVPSCPASVAVPNFVGQCGAVVTYSAPTATDNCPGVVLGQIAGSGSGSFFAVGTSTETYEATDAAGNTATCSFGVTINDVEAPTAVCPPSGIAQATDAGVCTAVVAYAASVVDNCNGATLSQTAGLGSGATFPLGGTTESYVATDLSGNSNGCSFAVTVSDQEAPVITAPGDYTVFVDEPYNFVVSAVDNCGTVTLAQDFGPLPGDSSPSTATEMVQFTATDSAGNAQTVQFTITVLPAAGGLGLNIYMYEEFDLVVATSAFGSDTWLTFELRPVGNGAAMYRSEQEPLSSVMRFQGPHDMAPGQVGFWVVSTSRTEYLTDINICGSRYVNFPDGCAVVALS